MCIRDRSSAGNENLLTASKEMVNNLNAMFQGRFTFGDIVTAVIGAAIGLRIWGK